MTAPTTAAYAEMQQAYDHFNKALFNGELPPCLITFQRQDERVMGYFSHKRFGRTDAADQTDEIALNPIHFKTMGLTEAMQTLVHEACHLWQAHFGTPSRSGYHNTEWSKKMDAVGLTPSSTGEPGGKRTGQKMADYPTPGGTFLSALATLTATGFRISYYDRIAEITKTAQEATASGLNLAGDADSEDAETPAQTTQKPGARVKFACPACGAAAWGKPTLDLTCNPCDEHLQPV
jgi:hypothetical protein